VLGELADQIEDGGRLCGAALEHRVEEDDVDAPCRQLSEYRSMIRAADIDATRRDSSRGE